MGRLIAGERDPKVLAQLARGRARAKISELAAGTGGRGVLHRRARRLLTTMLDRIDRVNAEITRCPRRSSGCWPPARSSCSRPSRCPAETPHRPGRPRRDRHGHDPVPHRRPPGLLGRPHPAGQLLRQAPAGRPIQEGQPVPGRGLGETAVAAGKTPTREGARYRRLARRRGKAKAQVALGNTQLKVYHKPCSPAPAPATRTSARTTTNASATPAARSPTTSASSAPSASRSPSPASRPNQTPKQAPAPPDQPAPPHTQSRLRCAPPGSCRAPG